MELLRITPYVTGSPKFKMAAVKTEICLSQLLDYNKPLSCWTPKMWGALKFRSYVPQS